MKDFLNLRGRLQLFTNVDGNRICLYDSPNQIQYIGARQIARGLIGEVYMPKISRIVASHLDPTVSRSKANPITPGFVLNDTPERVDNADSYFPVSASTSTLVINISENSSENPSIVSEGTLSRHTDFEENYSLRYFQFGLILSDNNNYDYILAYKFIPGGVGWGITNGLDCIWTIFLGA